MPPGCSSRLADPERAARAVRWLFDHPRQAADMGRQGRRRARRGFTPEAMCAGIDACYRELLGLPPPGPAPGP